MPLNRDAEQRGVVLMAVLVFALLLTTSVASFTHRAVIDAMISRNRDAAAEAEALARGGARLAAAMLVSDRVNELTNPLALQGDSNFDR